LQGFEIDLVNDFARSQKTHVSFIPTSWPGLSNDLKSGKFDLAIGGITATQEREKSFYLSKGLLPNGKIAVSHCKASHLYSSLEKIDKAGVLHVVKSAPN
jgi:cyclohexadienyl dehydratase